MRKNGADHPAGYFTRFLNYSLHADLPERQPGDFRDGAVQRGGQDHESEIKGNAQTERPGLDPVCAQKRQKITYHHN